MKKTFAIELFWSYMRNFREFDMTRISLEKPPSLSSCHLCPSNSKTTYVLLWQYTRKLCVVHRKIPYLKKDVKIMSMYSFFKYSSRKMRKTCNGDLILRPFEKGNDVTFGCRANNDKKVGPITQSEEIKPELTSLITLFSDNSISGFRFHCN